MWLDAAPSHLVSLSFRLMASNLRPFSTFGRRSFSGPEKVNSLSCQQIIIEGSALSLNRCQAGMAFL